MLQSSNRISKACRFCIAAKCATSMPSATTSCWSSKATACRAFDVILPDPIPGKGEVLTAMSDFWFEKLGHVIPNHLTGIAPETVVAPDERARSRAVRWSCASSSR